MQFIIRIDKEKPKITVSPTSVTIERGSGYNTLTGVSAKDEGGSGIKGNISASITNTTTLSVGEHTVTYTILDNAKNQGQGQRTIKVEKKHLDGIELCNNPKYLTTSGSGLYDMGDRCVYRGDSPKNYIKFNDQTWRILNINKTTGVIKIMAPENIGKLEFTSSCTVDRVNGFPTRAYIFNDLKNFYDRKLSESAKSSINQAPIWNIGAVVDISTLTKLREQEKKDL